MTELANRGRLHLTSNRREGREPGLPVPASRFAVWLALVAVTMLFVGLTSAYIVQRSSVPWAELPLPGLLWFNTAAIVGSSVLLEWAKRGSVFGHARLTRGVALGTALGVGFVAGQVVAWQQFSAQGVVLGSGAHAGFLYMLTSVHAVHVLVGIAALGFTLWKLIGNRRVDQLRELVDGVTLYWHFVGGLWIYVFALLYSL